MGRREMSLKRIVMAVFIGGILSIAVLVVIRDYWTMTCRQHMSRVEFTLIDIPSSAEDISMGKPGLLGPHTVVEFNCPELDFVDWATKRGYPLESVPHEFSVFGYEFCCSGNEVPKQTTIRNGYRYRKQYSEDALVEVAYDQETSRAYYRHSTR